ncbi:MAG TPA: hypothetical protein VGH66_07105, partial [Acidimicrobiales bacterium]
LPGWLPPLIAAAAAILSWLLGWRGVDLPAQIYRVSLFHRAGLTLWDSQWYGGHWTLDYTVIFPPVAGVLGLTTTAAVSAGGAALAFDRLVVDHFGPSGRVGSVLFAVGTTVQLAIGQLPFLLGEALALGACWAAARRRWPLAVVLGLLATLSSPLAGAFLGLAIAAWLLAEWPRRAWEPVLILAAVALPIVITAVVFPGQGGFPYPPLDFVVELGVALVIAFIVPRGQRVLHTAAILYVLATVASFVIPSPIGGNVGRLAECAAIPLGACVLWPRRKLLLVVVAVPIALLQWTPAWGAMTSNRSAPSTHEDYYQPLVAELTKHPQPLGRVEVVPTAFHWEAAYVAPQIPLARGWERQLDLADNPLFYDADRLDAAAYRAWLMDNGVRFVALSDAPLDFAGVEEARLVDAGVPGLVPAWSNAHWRVFAVAGSTGIVSGPARLSGMSAERIDLDATAAGSVTLRVRFNRYWTVTSGTACMSEGPDKWIVLHVMGQERVTLELRFAPSDPDRSSGCTDEAQGP